MTMRARLLAIMALSGVFLGSTRFQFMLALLSWSVIVWIVAEWIRFRSWVRWSLPRVAFERSINDQTETSTLWAGRKINMRVHITFPSPTRIHVRARDYVPELLEIHGSDAKPVHAWSKPASISTGSPRLDDMWDRWVHRLKSLLNYQQTLLAAQETQLDVGSRTGQISYSGKLLSAGRLQLPGVRLVLEDMNGLFRTHRFLEFPCNYRVLPAYYESGELRPTIKRQNSLPRQGIHRLQRSGLGSELLELREYVPGDPPKSIAWKVSARRDKLLTRQYESEVPVRVHLIIDGSVPTRIGGYGFRLLDQINYVAASIAQAAIAVGDPVDCLLVDETGVKRLPWFSGDRGLLELLKALADFSMKPPPTVGPVSATMKHMAMTVAVERYPELLDSRFNQVPLTFRAAYRRRFRLVGLISQLYNLSPRDQAACMLSDGPLAAPLQKFLHDAGMPWMAPLLPAPDEPTRSSQQRMDAISHTMVRWMMHAHDNEVFVVLADLLSAAPNFQSLERTVKLAIAKHHRVAFVCPTTTFNRPKLVPVLPGSESIADLLLAAERTRVRDFALQLKRDLTQLGAQVSFTGEQNAIRMVLAEIDTARSGRSHSQGMRV